MKNEKKYKLGASPERRLNKGLVALCSVLALVIIGALYWFFVHNNAPANQGLQDTTSGTSQDQQASTGDNPSPIKQPPVSDDIPVNPALAITNIGFSHSEGFINASAEVTGATQEGVCVFSFETNEGRPVVVQANGSTDCTVKIPEVEFDKIGAWNLTVTFYQDNQKTSLSKEVVVN